LNWIFKTFKTKSKTEWDSKALIFGRTHLNICFAHYEVEQEHTEFSMLDSVRERRAGYSSKRKREAGDLYLGGAERRIGTFQENGSQISILIV